MPAVVAGEPDGAHIFLNGRAHDVGRLPMIAEVDHLDPMSDELQIDRIDRAIVPVANRYRGEDA